MLQIKKAVRENVIWLKIAVTGPTGSGKTFGALGLAKGLSTDGRVCVIDTENASASYYADKWDFDVIELAAPFSIEKYLQAFQAAVEAGYKVIIIDSLSHEWAGQGGTLDEKAKVDKKGGSGWANWQTFKSAHGSFVDTFLAAQCHVIATIRSKMAYEQIEFEEAGRTKKKVEKLGMAPVQSDGIEYEFGVVFDVAQKTHMAESTKDRTGLFDKRTFLLNEAIGKELRAWRDGGKELAPEPAKAPAPAPKPHAKELAAENAKDSFIEGVEFIGGGEEAAIMDAVTQHNVPLGRFLTYLADKGHILRAANGDIRLDRLKATSFQKIYDILTDNQRRHAFVAALTSEAKTA